MDYTICVAELGGIDVFYSDIPETLSMAIPGAICLDWSLWWDGSEKNTRCAHELGHNKTGAFYTRNDPPCIRRRMENRANKWAIEHAVPKADMEAAIECGCTETWDLAERFNVTEGFIKKAIWYYYNGNLAAPA